MILPILIFKLVLQSAMLAPQWSCSDNCSPPDKEVTRIKDRTLNDRVVSCQIPKLPGLLDAKEQL